MAIEQLRIYETMEAIREAAESQPTKGEIRFTEYDDRTAMVPEGTRLPAKVNVYTDPKDMDVADRFAANSQARILRRVPVRIIEVEIKGAQGKLPSIQLFTVGLKLGA